MKSKFFATAAMLSGCVLGVQGQQLFPHRCAYDHAVQQRNQAFEGYKAAADATFLSAQQLGEWIQRQGQRSTYTVPVAVHVVWKTAAERLPECKILEQIATLNRDYQRLNADTANLRAVFQGVAGNPQIEFRLDTIIWQQSNTQFYSTGGFPDISVSDKVKHSADGGSDALDPAGYLNIWVCNMGTSGVLGYAYPPAGLAHWPANSQAPTTGDDGVVLDYRIVGDDGVYTMQGNTLNTQGRAACHEVGHYLGLRHIWGDGFSAIFGIPDCNATDGVNDTPTQGLGSNFACDNTQNTCGSGANDLPDMIENYMDYSDESCQNSFTNGQIAIMYGVLGNERNGLLQTAAPTTVRPANDAMMNAQSLTVNADTICGGVTLVSTQGATPSQAACAGAFANDVWYQFTAIAADQILSIANLSATDTVRYELLSGSCNNMVSLGCDATIGDVEDDVLMTGLSVGQDYYLRFYTDAGIDFEACLYLPATVIIGTPPLAWAQGITVFPNPSAGIFNISLKGMGQGVGQMELKNALGQSLGAATTWEGQTQAFQIDLSSQPDGLYWLELQWNGHTVAKPLVVGR